VDAVLRRAIDVVIVLVSTQECMFVAMETMIEVEGVSKAFGSVKAQCRCDRWFVSW
jgi:hypothetical protein